MSMYEAGEIIDEATRGVAPEVIERDDVQESLQYLFGWLDRLTDWIDPESDGYRESIYEAEHEGAVAVAERYRTMLEDALYRQKLFGEQFDLERFMERLHTIEIHEVLTEAR